MNLTESNIFDSWPRCVSTQRNDGYETKFCARNGEAGGREGRREEPRKIASPVGRFFEILMEYDVKLGPRRLRCKSR